MMSRQTVRGHLQQKGRRTIAELGLETGSAMVEVALVLPVMLLMFAGAVDYGRGYYVSIEVAAAAEAGALYGVQNSSDTLGMKAASILDAADVTGMNSTAVSGCECSDGTQVSSNCASAPSNCSGTVVNYVEVDTTANYVPFLSFPGIPGSFTLTGKSRMRTMN